MRVRSRILWTAFAALCFCLIAALPSFAAGPAFPPLTGRVVDDAGILSPDTIADVTSMLAQQEQQTGVQVVVVTLKSLQGYPIEDYGYRLGRYWGIGQKGKNNGALLVIAPAEHQARIEVGYGLEGQLTDAQSKIIIDEVLIPAFKRGDFNGGVHDATLAILKTIGGAKITSHQAPSARPDTGGDDSGIHIPIVVVIVFIWIVFGRFLWPLLFLGGFGGGWGGGRGGFGGGFGGGGFGGGGFGGGGGFSGGGGSFGGGGASGSW